MTLRTILCAGLAAGGSLLMWLGAAPAAEQPTTIDLKFVEQKDDPPFSWGSMLDATGKMQRPFATKSGRLTLQVTGDKLRVDSNGDGAIDEKDAPAVELKDITPTSRPTSPAKMVRVKVAVSFAGKTVDYPLVIQSQKIDEIRHLLMMGSAASAEGQFGQHTIRIFDSNFDGRFGDGDRVAIVPTGQAEMRGRGDAPWSRTVAIDRMLYTLQLLGSTGQLKVTPYAGPVAEVRIECEKSARDLRVTLQETGGAQVGVCIGDEPGLFVPGKYRFSMVQLQMGPADRPGFMYAVDHPDTPALELKAGANVVKVGPPLKLSFRATRSGSTLDLADVEVPGRAGELYRPDVQKEQGDVFAVFIKTGAKEQKLGDLEFG